MFLNDCFSTWLSRLGLLISGSALAVDFGLEAASPRFTGRPPKSMMMAFAVPCNSLTRSIISENIQIFIILSMPFSMLVLTLTEAGTLFVLFPEPQELFKSLDVFNCVCARI